MVLWWRGVCLGVGTMVLAGGARGQLVAAPVAAPVVSLQDGLAPLTTAAGVAAELQTELQAMSAQAGVIFAGQVMSIRRLGGGSGWVEVEFQVEQAVRGCVGQATYTLREWAGLWAGGVARYWVGERLLMLLHAPGASGLSSPVGGQAGAIPIEGTGVAPGQGSASTVAGDRAVDLRWVQTRVMRTAGSGSKYHGRPVAPIDEPVSVGREAQPEEMRKVVGVRSNQRMVGAAGLSVLPGAVNPVGARVSLNGLMGMLGAWEAQQGHDAR